VRVFDVAVKGDVRDVDQLGHAAYLLGDNHLGLDDIVVARSDGVMIRDVGVDEPFRQCRGSVVVLERAPAGDERSPQRAEEMNVLGFRREQLRVNRLSQAATLSEIEANC
jgi:hypothetical protein